MSNVISNIALCSVPISTTHQLTFENEVAQKEYFQAHCVRTINNCSYQARTSKIRVKGYVEEFSNVNYGYYDNTYDGKTKRYYFFIASREFVSKDLTYLNIYIDVVQTWMFNMSFGQCMIERCHVDSDEIGENTYPESFELGNLVTVKSDSFDELEGNVCYFMATTDEDSFTGCKFGKTYSGYTLKCYEESETAILTQDIKDMMTSGKADAIAFIFTYPREFLTDTIFDYIKTGQSIIDMPLVTKQFKFNPDLVEFKYKGNKYKPKNKKLFSYPYNFITVTNNSGGNVVLKHEEFINPSEMVFNIDSVLAQNPTFELTPLNYSGKQYSYEDSISLQGFGLCSWNNDNYSNWYANHKNSLNAQSQNAIASFNAGNQAGEMAWETGNENSRLSTQVGYAGAGMTAGAGIGNLLSGNLGGAWNSAANSAFQAYQTDVSRQQSLNSLNNDLSTRYLMNNTSYQNANRSLMASIQDAKVQPNTCKGDTTASGIDMARGTNTFYIRQTAIKPEYAKMIDMYFQMYGYQVNKVGYPSYYMNTRKKWNYVKTVGCVVLGNIPLEDKREIESIYNNGITFWHGDITFQYDVENAIA